MCDETYAEDLIDYLFTGCWGSENKQSRTNDKCNEYHVATEYPGYNGWNNNIGKPEVGAVDTQLLRRIPAAYEDGVNKPSGSNRPEPLEISEKLLSGRIGSKSKMRRNVLLVFFGTRKRFILIFTESSPSRVWMCEFAREIKITHLYVRCDLRQ